MDMKNVKPGDLQRQITKQLTKYHNKPGTSPINQSHVKPYNLYNDRFSGFGVGMDDVPKNKFGIDLFKPTQTHGWYDEGGEY